MREWRGVRPLALLAAALLVALATAVAQPAIPVAQADETPEEAALQALPTDVSVTQVLAEDERYGVLFDDGSLWTWDKLTPPAKLMDDVACASLGARCSAAVTSDGRLLVWDDATEPVELRADAASVACGGNRLAVVTNEGALLLQQGEDWTQLAEDVAAAAVSDELVAALTSSGSVLLWEDATGDPTTIMEGAAGVSVTGKAVFATKGDGTLWSFEPGDTGTSLVLSGVAQVAAGPQDALVLTHSGELAYLSQEAWRACLLSNEAVDVAELLETPVAPEAVADEATPEDATDDEPVLVVEWNTDDDADAADSSDEPADTPTEEAAAEPADASDAETPADEPAEDELLTEAAAKSIKKATVSAIRDQPYTGKAITPTPTVKLGSTTLKNGTDYTLSYKNNTKVGKATITVKGKGNYKDSVTATFKIVEVIDLSKKATIESIGQQTYSGQAITPGVTVKVGTKTLTQGTDYTVSYKSNTMPGTATVTVTGKTLYKGSKSATFKIVEVKIAWKRLAGNNRYETMKTIVDEGWKTSKIVVVARGDSYKDALAASGLAGLDEAPVVLTGGEELTQQAEAELKRLKPSKVYVIGGTAAITPDVLDAIAEATGLKVGKSIVRVAGTNAPATSAAIALQGKGRWSTEAFVVTSASYKDALSIAPIAYARKAPIFLATDGKSLCKEVLNAIKKLGITEVTIIGGTAAVTESVEKQLKKANVYVDRVAGSNAIETSWYIASWYANSLNNVGFATSDNFPDALAGAAFCGKKGSALLLANNSSEKGRQNVRYMKYYKSGLKQGYIFGGTSAFPAALVNVLPKNQSITGSNSTGPTNAQRDVIIKTALAQQGAPYVYASSDPSVGFDCSGFTAYCYEQAGISISHSSYAQWAQCQHITQAQAKRGDIICWSGHVAIYLGPDAGYYNAINAMNPSTPLKKIHWQYLTNTFYGFVRVI